MDSLVSIIIVTWNNEDVIANCIKSINVYEKEEVEIIVVDSASTDDTVQIIKDLNISNVTIIELDQNVGFAKSNNIGVEQAKSENILFLNPDTIIIESGLEEVFKILNSEIGVVGCRLLNNDGSLQPSCYNFETPKNLFLEQFMLGKFLPQRLKEEYTPYLGKHEKVKNVDWVIGAFIAMKKSCFTDIGGFSEDYFLYAEDMDLCYKVWKIKKKKIMFYPYYSIIHLGGQSEKKSFASSKQEKLLKSKIIFAQKYGLKNNIKTIYRCYQLKYLLFKTFALLTRKDLNMALKKYEMSKKILRENLRGADS